MKPEHDLNFHRATVVALLEVMEDPDLGERVDEALEANGLDPDEALESPIYAVSGGD